MPFPQHAANNSIDHRHPLAKVARRMRHFVGQTRAIRGNAVICRPSELLGQDVLEGRVSAGLYAGGHQYEDHRYEGRQSQHLCSSKNDQATNIAIPDSQCQQFYQRNLSPSRSIMGLLAQVTRVGLNTDNLLLKVQRCRRILQNRPSRTIVQVVDRELAPSQTGSCRSVIALVRHMAISFFASERCCRLFLNHSS
jgi:hypothetical protein